MDINKWVLIILGMKIVKKSKCMGCLDKAEGFKYLLVPIREGSSFIINLLD